MNLKRLLVFFVCTSLLTIKVGAQDISRIESLNTFFGGIPLSEGLDSCKQYVLNNPMLGIDSMNAKGIYSSFKQEKKNHFPFPDSVEVKIMLLRYRGQGLPVLREIPMGTQGIAIAGMFGTDKNSEKASIKVYNQLKKTLPSYYGKKEDDGFDHWYYSKGINKNFPNCLLMKYQNALKRYCVILEYWEM